jgi:hypothetical protein
LQKYFPKKPDWKNYQNQLNAIILDPHWKMEIMERINFNKDTISDIRENFGKNYDQ